MSTSKTPAVAQEAAPYGLTKAGKPRKRPAPNREGICPVKGCGQNFQTRDDPVKAVYQHCWRYTKTSVADYGGEKAVAHRTAFSKLPTKTKCEKQNSETKKLKNKTKVKNWKAKNPEKAKKSAVLSQFKWKAKRYLKKGEQEVTDTAVEEMAKKWMCEKYGKDWEM